MKKYKIVLGIETSCDETSASVIRSNFDFNNNFNSEILSLIIHSQDHSKYGGVIPEFAARDHIKSIDSIVKKSLNESNIKINEIDLIAVTNGPGLMGGLVVGLMYAKGLSISNKIPFLGVNHLTGHLLTTRLTHKINFPYLSLLISGGHCQIVEVESFNDYKILSQTLDDSAGEVFDKVAKMLDLPYPGGPHIEYLAKTGDEDKFKLPIPMLGKQDMSFSGLKNAMRILIQNCDLENDRPDICASFQKTICKSLIYSLKKNIPKSICKNLCLVGGVASNIYIRSKIQEFAKSNNLKLICPEPKLCTDNAAMIAWVGIEHLFKNSFHNKNSLNIGINEF